MRKGGTEAEVGERKGGGEGRPDSSLATNNSNTPAAAIPIRARNCPLERPIKILSVSYVKEPNSEKGCQPTARL